MWNPSAPFAPSISSLSVLVSPFLSLPCSPFNRSPWSSFVSSAVVCLLFFILTRESIEALLWEEKYDFLFFLVCIFILHNKQQIAWPEITGGFQQRNCFYTGQKLILHLISAWKLPHTLYLCTTVKQELVLCAWKLLLADAQANKIWVYVASLVSFLHLSSLLINLQYICASLHATSYTLCTSAPQKVLGYSPNGQGRFIKYLFKRVIWQCYVTYFCVLRSVGLLLPRGYNILWCAQVALCGPWVTAC